MSGHRFRVDTGAIDSSKSRVQRGATQIKAELDTLVSEITGLTSAEWTGGAAGAFHAQYLQLDRGWKQVEHALNDIANQMAGTSSTYTQVEEGLQSSFRRA